LQEIKSVEHRIQDVQQQHDRLIEQMQDKQDQMQQLQDAIKELEAKLEEGKLQRQKVHHSFAVLFCVLKNLHLLPASFSFLREFMDEKSPVSSLSPQSFNFYFWSALLLFLI
jgi:predicted nuclease with TOPRIM domain